jgi:hypothetical protein
MKLTKKAHRWLREIKAAGYAVAFVPYCEDHETPGFLGQIAGVTMYAEKKVKIATRRKSPQHIEAALAHELEHVNGAARGTDYPHLGLRCGGCLSNMLQGVP